MFKTREIPWPRIFAEGIAIVVSILLAFAIEAWWQERQDRSDLSLVLSSLIGELDELKKFDEQSMIFVAAIRESAQTLLAASQNSEEPLSTKEIDSLLADLLWTIGPSLSNYPELDSLIANGNISLIPNVELRQELGSLKSDLAAHKSIYQTNQDFIYTVQMPFLDAHADLVQIGAEDDGQPGITIIPSEYAIAHSPHVTDHSKLLENAEFRNILMRKVWMIDDIFVFHPENLAQRIDSIIAMIEYELSK